MACFRPRTRRAGHRSPEGSECAVITLAHTHAPRSAVLCTRQLEDSSPELSDA